MIAVVDTAGVSALVPLDQRRRDRLQEVHQLYAELVLPSAVLAEGLYTGHPGHDHHLRRLLASTTIAAIDGDLGNRAGWFRSQARRGGADPPPSGVDAMVAAVAEARATDDEVVIITGDAGDMIALLTRSDLRNRITLQPA